MIPNPLIAARSLTSLLAAIAAFATAATAVAADKIPISRLADLPAHG